MSNLIAISYKNVENIVKLHSESYKRSENGFHFHFSSFIGFSTYDVVGDLYQASGAPASLINEAKR